MRRVLRWAQRTFVGIRDYIRDGGSTYVSIAQIDYGSILHGKSVLVTGGGTGIGLAIAKKCLSQGASVLITGRRLEVLKQAVAQCGDSPRLKYQVWDIAEVGRLESCINNALELLGGRIDILINSAGVNTHGTFLKMTESEWDMISSVNSKGMFFLTQAICRRWITAKQPGKVINISSERGFLGVVDGPYGMSKWGMVGLTRGMGQMFLKHNIIVNGIAPGVIGDTGMNRHRSGVAIDCNENVYIDFPPSNRCGCSAEIAELALFLMSDAANYIVGQTIICDGGYTLKL